VNLYDAMVDQALLGKTFGGPTFKAWRTVAKALDGLPLDADEFDLYHALTQRETAPTVPVSEAYFIKIRRSGGTLFGGGLGLHAAIQDYRHLLGPGEYATVAMIAADRKQARQLMAYCKGLIADSPAIAAEVIGETSESITFRHRTRLEIHVVSFRSTRGYSYAAVVMDEMAFYRDDLSANPDVELVRAVRPGLANLNGRLLGFSSPHAKRGHLYAMYQEHFGKDSDVLVLNATHHSQMNPTIDQRRVDKALKEDRVGALAEWFGQFRSAEGQWLDDALIDIALELGRLPRGSSSGLHAYCDLSGGLHDASAMAICHSESAVGLRGASAPPNVFLDRIDYELAPHEPSAVVERFVKILKQHGIRSVTGDRYAGSWVSDAFVKAGITYTVSEQDKSAIYGECAALFAEQRVQLINNPRLVTELRMLERRPRMGGRADGIDHPRRGNAHDDLANAVCGALVLASKGMDRTTMWNRLSMNTGEFIALVENAPKPAPYVAPTPDEILTNALEQQSAAQARLDAINRQLADLEA
jgi:hypothetical protein